MRYMLSVSQRMAIGTKNMQVFWFIIFAIEIIMVNAKNFLNGIISAIFALIYPSSTFKGPSSKGKTTFTIFKLPFFSAFNRTIFSCPRWGIKKWFLAFNAYGLNGTSAYLRNMKAFSRTIFSCFCAAINHIKFRTADLTVYLYSIGLVFMMPKTFARAIFKNIFSIIRDFDKFIAIQTMEMVCH